MAKVEFGLVRDIPWLYYTEGNEPSTVFVTEVYGKNVKLSNGDVISHDQFWQMCEKMVDDDGEYEQTEGSLSQEMLDLVENENGEGNDMIGLGGEAPQRGPKPGGSLVEEMMSGVQFDENGIPVVTNPAPRIHQQRPLRASTQNVQQAQVTVNDSPLIALAEKAQTKPSKINVQFEVPTVNKVLFNALIDTYPEEEIDVLLEWMINKMGIENIKDIMKQKILSHYKSGKKDVTS